MSDSSSPESQTAESRPLPRLPWQTRVLRGLLSGVYVSAGAAVLGLIVALMRRAGLVRAIVWTELAVGTVLVAVAALMLMGRPSAAPPRGKSAEASGAPPPAKYSVEAARRAAQYATSSERERQADAGFFVFAMGAVVVGIGFLLSYWFKV